MKKTLATILFGASLLFKIYSQSIFDKKISEKYMIRYENAVEAYSLFEILGGKRKNFLVDFFVKDNQKIIIQYKPLIKKLKKAYSRIEKQKQDLTKSYKIRLAEGMKTTDLKLRKKVIDIINSSYKFDVDRLNKGLKTFTKDYDLFLKNYKDPKFIQYVKKLSESYENKLAQYLKGITPEIKETNIKKTVEFGNKKFTIYNLKYKNNKVQLKLMNENYYLNSNNLIRRVIKKYNH